MIRWTRFLLMTLAAPLAAQRSDSAQVARQAMGEAGAALARGDSAAALASVLAATRAWPAQGAYRVSAARLAAALGHDAEAVALLERLNASGYAWNTTASEYRHLADQARFARLADGSASNQAPMTRSSLFRTLPDERLHPEDVAFDPATGRVFVSSVRQRKVVALLPDGRLADFALGGDAGFDAVLALAVDSARGRLWLTTSDVPEQDGGPHRHAAVVGVDLERGLEIGRWSVGDASEHVLGELVIGPDGAVWATDSRSPRVFRVDAPDGQGGALRDAGWTSRDWVSLQGLAIAPEGDVAWIADWTTGLYRIDLASGTVAPMAGGPDQYLLGIDGLLALDRHRLVAIQNGIVPPRVIALQLSDGADRVVDLKVLDRHLPAAEEPTNGVLANGSLVYVANSPWGHYRPDGTPDPARPFPKPVLLRLELQ